MAQRGKILDLLYKCIILNLLIFAILFSVYVLMIFSIGGGADSKIAEARAGWYFYSIIFFHYLVNTAILILFKNLKMNYILLSYTFIAIIYLSVYFIT